VSPGDLPCRCVPAVQPREVDTELFRGESASIGRFRCPVDHRSFSETWPATECLVVFPRTAVWIRHEGSVRFLADSTVATIYNRAQRYDRFVASADGDRCDWFGVSDELAREIAAALDPSVADRERPFRFEWAPSTARLYYRQREVLRAVERGELDACAAEEAIIGVVASVVALAYGQPDFPRLRASARRRALVDAARLEILRGLDENRSVRSLADSLGSSPFHLCRVFRAYTGRTMHEYRTELRLRRVLDWFHESKRATIGEIALRAGFASHSHLVQSMARHLRVTPTIARLALR